jgi:hypothetical protein
MNADGRRLSVMASNHARTALSIVMVRGFYLIYRSIASYTL